MSVCCDCCVLSGRGLCEGLITRPEESYRLWCVVCDIETTKIFVNEESKAHYGAKREREREKELVRRRSWNISNYYSSITFEE